MLHQLLSEPRNKHQPTVGHHIRCQPMMAPYLPRKGHGQILGWRLLSRNKRNKVSHVGQPIHHDPNLRIPIRLGKASNEIHRNRPPGLMGNLQRLQQTVLLPSASFVSLTDIAAPYIVLDVVVHLGPEKVLPYPFQCLELAKMPRYPRVMVGLQDLQPEGLVVGEDISVLIQKQTLFHLETRSNQFTPSPDCLHGGHPVQILAARLLQTVLDRRRQHKSPDGRNMSGANHPLSRLEQSSRGSFTPLLIGVVTMARQDICLGVQVTRSRDHLTWAPTAL